ncbi:MAG: hypothetical protein Q8P83_03605 [bacterium]|nr:hypothetical protein [bacterium]
MWEDTEELRSTLAAGKESSARPSKKTFGLVRSLKVIVTVLVATAVVSTAALTGGKITSDDLLGTVSQTVQAVSDHLPFGETMRVRVVGEDVLVAETSAEFLQLSGDLPQYKRVQTLVRLEKLEVTWQGQDATAMLCHEPGQSLYRVIETGRVFCKEDDQ